MLSSLIRDLYYRGPPKFFMNRAFPGGYSWLIFVTLYLARLGDPSNLLMFLTIYAGLWLFHYPVIRWWDVYFDDNLHMAASLMYSIRFTVKALVMPLMVLHVVPNIWKAPLMLVLFFLWVGNFTIELITSWVDLNKEDGGFAQLALEDGSFVASDWKY